MLKLSPLQLVAAFSLGATVNGIGEGADLLQHRLEFKPLGDDMDPIHVHGGHDTDEEVELDEFFACDAERGKMLLLALKVDT
jgi:hypothetical protein